MKSWRKSRHFGFLIVVIGAAILFWYVHRDGGHESSLPLSDNVWLVVAVALALLELPSLLSSLKGRANRRTSSAGLASRNSSPSLRMLLLPVMLMTFAFTFLAVVGAILIRYSSSFGETETAALLAVAFAVLGMAIAFSLRRIGIFAALNARNIKRMLNKTALTGDDHAAANSD